MKLGLVVVASYQLNSSLHIPLTSMVYMMYNSVYKSYRGLVGKIEGGVRFLTFFDFRPFKKKSA